MTETGAPSLMTFVAKVVNSEMYGDVQNGQMVYYNFVRPHQTLEGKTPAEVAGIGVQGENKWMELLKRSLKK